MWTEYINFQLNGSQDKIRNNSEMASIFKKLNGFFQLKKSSHAITFEGIRKSKTFYTITQK